MKLNVLLGKVETLSGSFKQSIKDYVDFFKKQQGQFQGIRKTYLPRPDTVDLPSEKQSKKIVTTVKEKLDWLEETNKDYIDALFAVEATNASGVATAPLVIDGINFGSFTAGELLRLVSLLSSEDLKQMYENIPVRSDAENWNKSIDDLYQNREGIYEVPITSGIKKSIMKEQYILKDPNMTDATAARYVPVTSTRDTSVDLGDWTLQHFTGEASQRERAEILRRYTKLLVAAKGALKTANEAEVQESWMTSKKLFGYLHTGSIE